jgi:hypothetical protein
MQFAIWDRDTNLRPTDLNKIGKVEPILYSKGYSSYLNKYVNTSVPLKYHDCQAEEIEMMGPGIEEYAGP